MNQVHPRSNLAPPFRPQPAGERSRVRLVRALGPCLFLAVLVVACSSACSSPSEPLPVTPGRSDRPRGGATVPAPSAIAPPAPWDRWPEVASFRVAVPRSPSQHLGGDHEAEILASPEAAAYPDLGPARLLPPGSALVERLYAPESKSPEIVFAMVQPRSVGPASPSSAPRDAGPSAESPPTGMAPAAAAWEFLVLASDGTVQERGALETCARCHAEAPNDGVFGRAQ